MFSIIIMLYLHTRRTVWIELDWIGGVKEGRIVCVCHVGMRESCMKMHQHGTSVA